MNYFKSYTVLYLILFCLELHGDDDPQELMDDAHCMRCHATTDFQPREEKVNSFRKLHHQVGVCAENNFAGWFEEEKLDVSNHLDWKHYHFKSGK
ncbi:hypothetical protein [Sulfurimonas microaerophilic]|uniref:hypothetical protein n=1 Tax=Sulfurimonas microaerophilic TaxID=3058392 RepID=UPI00271452ED|nr:hypothetical protein [Sulfurimonas sp. hsl 1-7]